MKRLYDPESVGGGPDLTAEDYLAQDPLQVRRASMVPTLNELASMQGENSEPASLEVARNADTRIPSPDNNASYEEMDAMVQEDQPVESRFPSLSSLSSKPTMLAAAAPKTQEEQFAEALGQTRDAQKYAAMQQATNALLAGAARYKGGQDVTGAANQANKAYVDMLASKAQDVQSKEKFGQDVLSGKSAKNKFEQTQKEQDPNSDVSQSFRKAIERLSPELVKSYGADWAKVSAADKNDIWDIIKTKEQIDARRDLARERAAAKKDEIDKLDLLEKREKLKEESQIKKENRKTLSEVDKSEEAAKAMLRDLKTAKERFESYSKGMGTGTGPIATLGGLTKFVSQDTEKLDAAFKKVSMENMVKQFAGMSKAIDSDAERRSFEATQPSIRNDDDTNRQILDDQIKAAERLVAKTQAYKKQFNRATGEQVYENRPEDMSNEASKSNEETRLTKTGRRAIFDKDTKKFIRWAD